MSFYDSAVHTHDFCSSTDIEESCEGVGSSISSSTVIVDVTDNENDLNYVEVEVLNILKDNKDRLNIGKRSIRTSDITGETNDNNKITHERRKIK